MHNFRMFQFNISVNLDPGLQMDNQTLQASFTL